MRGKKSHKLFINSCAWHDRTLPDALARMEEPAPTMIMYKSLLALLLPSLDQLQCNKFYESGYKQKISSAA